MRPGPSPRGDPPTTGPPPPKGASLSKLVGVHGSAVGWELMPALIRSVQAYYTSLFKKVFDTPEWQDYMKKNSLRGAFLSGLPLMSYWLKEREKHERWDRAVRAMKR